MANPYATDHVDVGELRLYVEQYGDPDGPATPLLLLHGGLFDIELQFGALLPGLSSGRRVIAVEFQGHGHTNDLDRPFSSAAFAGDVLGVLDHVGLNCVDVFGFSVGGAVALELAVRRPERVRRLIASSVSFRASGMRGSENAQAVGEMKVEMIAGTPMEAAYLATSPHPDHEHLQGLLDKPGATYAGGFPDWADDDIRGIAAPTLITVGRRRHGQPRPRRGVPAVARRRRERRLRRAARLATGRLSGHVTLHGHRPNRPGDRRRGAVPRRVVFACE